MSEAKTIRPILPELESVNSAERSYLALSVMILIVIAAALAALTTYVYAVVKQTLGSGFPGWQEWLPVSLGLFLLIAIGLSFTSWFDYKCKTDTQQLTCSGLLHKRSISWSDISRMTLIHGTGSNPYCKVTVEKRDITVGTLGPKSQILVASVWQHLNKRGIVTEDELPTLAKSLWTPIPSAIPQEMDWHNPKSVDRQTAISGTALAASLVLLAVYAVVRLGYAESLFKHSQHVITTIIAGLVAKFHSRFQSAQSAVIRTDRFEARTLLSSVYIPWSQIKSAQLVKNNLVLNCGGFRNTVMLPYDVNSDDTVHLVLAAIRRLRSSEKPLAVMITEPLASAKYLTQPSDTRPAALSDEPIELRPSMVFRVVTPLILVAFSFCLFTLIATLSLSLLLVKVITVVACVYIALAIIGTFHLRRRLTRVDSNGITVQSLLTTKFVSWGEIASYSVKSYPSVPNASMRIIKDSNGRVLISLIYTGRNNQHCKFEAYVDAKLASVPRD